MKALVLAAGEGTRIRPMTKAVPKPLLEVDGRPLLSYCFDTVLECGLTQAVVVVGYRSEQIIDYYGNSYRGLTLEYVYQSNRKGLAHAVVQAKSHLDGAFVVLNGDNVYAGNECEAVETYRKTESDVTFLVEDVTVEQAKTGAVCEFDGDGNLVGLVEKPTEPSSTTVPTAFYVLPPETVPACEIVRPSSRGEYELPDAIDILLYSGYSVETVPYEGWRINVNDEADLNRAAAKVREMHD